MKKLLFVLLLGISWQLYAQNDNPYSLFGHEGKVIKTPAEEQMYMMVLINADTTATIRKIAIDAIKGKVNYYDKTGKIMEQGTLEKTDLARFLSVDPIARKYPELTPFQFASNTPIRAIDLDGLEAFFGRNGEFLYWGPDKTDNAKVIIYKVEERHLRSSRPIGGRQELSLTVGEFRNRTAWVFGESGREFYRHTAHTIQNIEDLWRNADIYTNHNDLQNIRMGVGLTTEQYVSEIVNRGFKSDFSNSGVDGLNQRFATKAVIEASLRGDAGLILSKGGYHENDPTKGAVSWVTGYITGRTDGQNFKDMASWQEFANTYKDKLHPDAIQNTNVFTQGKTGTTTYSNAYQKRTDEWMKEHTKVENTGSKEKSALNEKLRGSHPSH